MSPTAPIPTVLAWLSLLTTTALAATNTTTVPLRIMSLGASVTFGVGSTTGDSYRQDLLQLLTANGNTVEYVGQMNNGNFTQNAVEATPGFVISQIAASAMTAVPMFKPNLVLIDAGTNNCNNGGTVPDAGQNVTNMINEIYKQSPGATVVLTTILVNSVAEQDACRLTINTQYQNLTTALQATGAKLVLVDMRSPAGPLVTDLADGRHPNDAGYVKMANVWFGGIQQVISKGFLTAPVAVSNTNSNTNTNTNTNMNTKTSGTSRSSSSSSSKSTAKVSSSGMKAMNGTAMTTGSRVGSLTSSMKVTMPTGKTNGSMSAAKITTASKTMGAINGTGALTTTTIRTTTIPNAVAANATTAAGTMSASISKAAGTRAVGEVGSGVGGDWCRS